MPGQPMAKVQAQSPEDQMREEAMKQFMELYGSVGLVGLILIPIILHIFFGFMLFLIANKTGTPSRGSRLYPWQTPTS